MPVASEASASISRAKSANLLSGSLSRAKARVAVSGSAGMCSTSARILCSRRAAVSATGSVFGRAFDRNMLRNLSAMGLSITTFPMRHDEVEALGLPFIYWIGWTKTRGLPLASSLLPTRLTAVRRYGARLLAYPRRLPMVRGCMVMLFTSFGLAASGGCQRSPSQVAAAEPPVLPVSKPVPREVTNYVDFTGRTDAVEAVDIRPRVTGYLKRMPFKEGSKVKKGDLLFEIDPRPYKAQLDQAQGQVDLNQASFTLAQVTY